MLEIIYILTTLFTVALGVFVYARDKTSDINRIFLCMATVSSFWLLVNISWVFFAYIFLARLSYAIGTFIPPFVLQFSYALNGQRLSRLKSLALWFVAWIVSLLVISPFMLIGVKNISIGGFDATYFFPLFFCWVLFMLAVSIWSIAMLIKIYYISLASKKLQIKYVGLGFGIAIIYCMFSDVVMPLFGNNKFMPFDVLAFLFFLVFTAYAIVKYQLMNIRVAITRAGIFILVYAIVLGLPLWLAYGSGLGRNAIWFMLVFATLGPFAYNRLRLAIERQLFEKEKSKLLREEQTRRQRALDNFSLSLAHEIDNPAVAAMGLTRMVKERLSDLNERLNEKERDYFNNRLNQIHGDVGRIVRLVKVVRDFAAIDKGQLNVIPLNDAIDDFATIIAPQLKEENIEFALNVCDGIKITGNKIYLQEVLMILAENSRHALQDASDGKRISLAVKSNLDNKTVLIEFSDNGCGIAKELIEDIFLDFVTTKGSSQNLGMGLSRARKIITRHNGRIWAQSDGEGKGASIFVELPIY